MDDLFVHLKFVTNVVFVVFVTGMFGSWVEKSLKRVREKDLPRRISVRLQTALWGTWIAASAAVAIAMFAISGSWAVIVFCTAVTLVCCHRDSIEVLLDTIEAQEERRTQLTSSR